MKILYVTGEVAPFSKTGGLGDVAYALPKALVKQGVDIRVVSPYYTSIPEEYKSKMQEQLFFYIHVGQKHQYVGVKTLVLDNVTYYFIDNLDYFDRAALYGEWDDGERFGFFSMAVIEMMEKVRFIPDIIHVNDWHTAMIPALLVDKYHWIQDYRHIRKVLTIHNLRFQGVFDPVVLNSIFNTTYALYTEDGAKYYDAINYLKAGINFSDRVTTVSPTYASEIQTVEFGEGLETALQHNHWKIHGILNGIDIEIYNPETDKFIPHHFTKENLLGKKQNKAHLQQSLGLPVNENVPVISCVSRLTDQKGFQLVEQVLEELLQQDVQVVILGTGEKRFEQAFEYFSNKYPQKCKAVIGFDVKLAQLLYAASDLFLMPSAFEPCGLSQLMALRYGTLPVVHETGGLRDTVLPYNASTGEGTGFSFYDFDRHTLLNTLNNAIDVYYNQPEQWQQLVQQAMSADFSWYHPTKTYMAMYQTLLSE